jgi:hypothetical protein
MFTTTWYPTGEDSERGQVSSGQRGLYYAIHNMRRGVAEGTITSARVIGHDQKVIYASAGEVDLYPQCAWCSGAYCEDISAHYDRQATAGRRPFYYQPDSGLFDAV